MIDRKKIKQDAETAIKIAKEYIKYDKYNLAVDAILVDLADRKGIKQELREIDKAVMENELKPTLKEILIQIFEE